MDEPGSGAVDRRTLIKGTAAAGTAAVVGAASGRTASAAAAGTGLLRAVDVAVVGAGLAGMSAARRLMRAGRSVIVLEARGRTGGRVLNGSIGGGVIQELGAEFRGVHQPHLDALIKEAKAKLFPTFETGKLTLYYRGKVLRANGLEGIPLPPEDVAGLVDLINTLEEMAAGVSLENPQTAWHAAEWDSQTLASWITDNTDPGLARDVALEVGGWAIACDSEDISLLHFLSQLKANGGALRLIGIKGGNLQNRIHGGTGVLTDFLERKLGDAIMLNAPVRAIDQRGAKVRLETDAGTVQAGRVIVAIPPTLAGRIAYDPPMPAARDGLTQRAPMGYAIKTFFVYPRPFWRDAGLSGNYFTDVGPSRFGFDNSPPSGKPGVLLAFVEANDGRYWGTKSERARRSAIQQQLVKLFGPRAARPTKYVEMDWAKQQWTRGCYTWFLPPGVLTQYGEAVRRPVGRIHWAGTEMATTNWCLMDGAIASGERAAGEVLRA